MRGDPEVFLGAALLFLPAKACFPQVGRTVKFVQARSVLRLENSLCFGLPGKQLVMLTVACSKKSAIALW